MTVLDTIVVEVIERGPQGPQGEQGPAFVHWERAWSSATTYQVNDAVSHEGSSYICIEAHTNEEPPNATYWDVIASKGDTGARGLGLDDLLVLGAAPYNSDASSGWFADYDCKANVVLRMSQAENLTTVDGPGAFRELLFVEHVDEDVIDYTAIGQRVSMAMRAIVSGARDGGGDYALQYKDLVGADFAAIGRIGWPARGVSGIVASATQMGSGIASNEFSVENPHWAQEQSISMAGVQGIVRVGKADAGPGHTYFGVLSTTVGMKSTAAFGANGQSLYSIYLADNTVHYAAIRMPQSGAGHVGTIIEYDANDYSLYDRYLDEYMWVIGGAIIKRMSSSAITSLVPIVLPANPIHDMHAATKKYVDDAIAAALA